jgi:Fur family ferric uptake transcriptional regulator
VTAVHLTPAVEASTPHAAFAALRARGLRISSARRLLLQALFDADHPLSAEELAADGDLASTYRNLERLEALGVVRHVHLGHGPARFAPAATQRSLALCEGCGAVASLPADAVAGVRRAVLEAVGYDVRCTHFPLAGLCPSCAAR